MEGIILVFEDFATISGLNISKEKSTMYLTGISTRKMTRIDDRFSFCTGELPVRYLGLPLLTKRMTKTNYAPLIETLRSRISSWTTRFLSYAGRLQLIKSVLASVINFWIAAFCLPQGSIIEIESLCSAFLWSGPRLHGKTYADHMMKVNWV